MSNDYRPKELTVNTSESAGCFPARLMRSRGNTSGTICSTSSGPPVEDIADPDERPSGRERDTSSGVQDLRKSEVFIFRYRESPAVHCPWILGIIWTSAVGTGSGALFTLVWGSQIDPSTMPRQVFAALYRAFEQVPQQILWKCAKGENASAAERETLSASNGRPRLAALCVYV